MSAGGVFKLNGGYTLDFNDGAIPAVNSAFWNSASAQKRFAELGVDAFQLWSYGEGAGADDPRAHLLRHLPFFRWRVGRCHAR